jgi:hypothetical protein
MILRTSAKKTCMVVVKMETFRIAASRLLWRRDSNFSQERSVPRGSIESAVNVMHGSAPMGIIFVGFRAFDQKHT